MNPSSHPVRPRVRLACVLAALAAAPAHAAPPRVDAARAADAASAPEVDPTAVERGMVPRLDVARLSGPTRLCGWWDGPTPGNVWLDDRSARWTIAMQGMYEASGEGPDFPPGQRLPEDAPYGYGCACITARVDRASKFVYSFTDAKALPLTVCRADPGLRKYHVK